MDVKSSSGWDDESLSDVDAGENMIRVYEIVICSPSQNYSMENVRKRKEGLNLTPYLTK